MECFCFSADHPIHLPSPIALLYVDCTNYTSPAIPHADIRDNLDFADVVNLESEADKHLGEMEKSRKRHRYIIPLAIVSALIIMLFVDVYAIPFIISLF